MSNESTKPSVSTPTSLRVSPSEAPSATTVVTERQARLSRIDRSTPAATAPAAWTERIQARAQTQNARRISSSGSVASVAPQTLVQTAEKPLAQRREETVAAMLIAVAGGIAAEPARAEEIGVAISVAAVKAFSTLEAPQGQASEG